MVGPLGGNLRSGRARFLGWRWSGQLLVLTMLIRRGGLRRCGCACSPGGVELVRLRRGATASLRRSGAGESRLPGRGRRCFLQLRRRPDRRLPGAAAGRTAESLPAVVYLHGTGGDRAELRVQSTWLVARGAVALTITAPSAVTPTPRGLSPVALLRWQVQIQRRDVVAVRRALDLLSRRRDVDPARIGFVAGARRRAHRRDPRRRRAASASDRADVGSHRPRLGLHSPRTSGAASPDQALPRQHRPTALPPAGERLVARLQDGRNDAIVPRGAAHLRPCHTTRDAHPPVSTPATPSTTAPTATSSPG